MPWKARVELGHGVESSRPLLIAGRRSYAQDNPVFFISFFFALKLHDREMQLVFFCEDLTLRVPLP